MLQRRIISLGRSSMVISLPKNWLELNELKKGDAVSYAIQRDRSLVVYPGAKKQAVNKEITHQIAQNEDCDLITQKIIGSFLAGYTGITLISEKIFSIIQMKAIRKIAMTLYMRIMESNSKGVYIQTIADESKASLDQAIQRMYMISRSMCEDVFISLKDNNLELARAVFSLDEDVDHFSFFIIRLLRNAAQNPALANEFRIDPLDCMDHQNLIYRLEHASDYSSDIARHIVMLAGTKQKIPDDVLSLMVTAGNEACELYIDAVNAFFLKDVPFSVDIMKRQSRIEKLDTEIASKAFVGKQKNAELVCAICSIRDNIKRIADCAAIIAEIAVNRAFKSAT
ncbi:MAG: phosphate uptake regulator PhoU [Candidatus Bathyarchaeota archaeon]|jgi:phosphate uptake regulator|nr:phosphate uptake regulator PhoU [Candidatus Bathyarchaeota archaeon]